MTNSKNFIDAFAKYKDIVQELIDFPKNTLKQFEYAILTNINVFSNNIKSKIIELMDKLDAVLISGQQGDRLLLSKKNYEMFLERKKKFVNKEFSTYLDNIRNNIQKLYNGLKNQLLNKNEKTSAINLIEPFLIGIKNQTLYSIVEIEKFLQNQINLKKINLSKDNWKEINFYLTQCKQYFNKDNLQQEIFNFLDLEILKLEKNLKGLDISEGKKGEWILEFIKKIKKYILDLNIYKVDFIKEVNEFSNIFLALIQQNGSLLTPHIIPQNLLLNTNALNLIKNFSITLKEKIIPLLEKFDNSILEISNFFKKFDLLNETPLTLEDYKFLTTQLNFLKDEQQNSFIIQQNSKTLIIQSNLQKIIDKLDIFFKPFTVYEQSINFKYLHFIFSEKTSFYPSTETRMDFKIKIVQLFEKTIDKLKLEIITQADQINYEKWVENFKANWIILINILRMNEIFDTFSTLKNIDMLDLFILCQNFDKIDNMCQQNLKFDQSIISLKVNETIDVIKDPENLILTGQGIIDYPEIFIKPDKDKIFNNPRPVKEMIDSLETPELINDQNKPNNLNLTTIQNDVQLVVNLSSIDQNVLKTNTIQDQNNFFFIKPLTSLITDPKDLFANQLIKSEQNEKFSKSPIPIPFNIKKNLILLYKNFQDLIQEIDQNMNPFVDSNPFSNLALLDNFKESINTISKNYLTFLLSKKQQNSTIALENYIKSIEKFTNESSTDFENLKKSFEDDIKFKSIWPNVKHYLQNYYNNILTFISEAKLKDLLNLIPPKQIKPISIEHFETLTDFILKDQILPALDILSKKFLNFKQNSIPLIENSLSEFIKQFILIKDNFSDVKFKYCFNRVIDKNIDWIILSISNLNIIKTQLTHVEFLLSKINNSKLSTRNNDLLKSELLEILKTLTNFRVYEKINNLKQKILFEFLNFVEKLHVHFRKFYTSYLFFDLDSLTKVSLLDKSLNIQFSPTMFKDLDLEFNQFGISYKSLNANYQKQLKKLEDFKNKILNDSRLSNTMKNEISTEVDNLLKKFINNNYKILLTNLESEINRIQEKKDRLEQYIEKEKNHKFTIDTSPLLQFINPSLLSTLNKYLKQESDREVSLQGITLKIEKIEENIEKIEEENIKDITRQEFSSILNQLPLTNLFSKKTQIYDENLHNIYHYSIENLQYWRIFITLNLKQLTQDKYIFLIEMERKLGQIQTPLSRSLYKLLHVLILKIQKSDKTKQDIQDFDFYKTELNPHIRRIAEYIKFSEYEKDYEKNIK